MAKTSTTCQICGREIKVVRGWCKQTDHTEWLISHHGYQRPGSGWQTASCFGARWRPYEVACDALPPAIENIQHYIAGLEAAARRHKSAPPRGLPIPAHGYGPFGHNISTQTMLRPVDFDPNAEHKFYDPPGGGHSYGWLWECLKSERALWVKHAKSDLGRLRRRLADWKAP